MIKVTVVAVGKVKEKYFLEGIDEYSKRLSKFCQFKIQELPEKNYKSPTNSQIEEIIKAEGDKILESVDFKGKVFALAIEGQKLSSIELAKKIANAQDQGQNIIFIIGGSYGLDKRVKEKATGLISFSDMTFPHTLFRLMLTEQIYRAFSISNGSPYHK